MYTFGVHNSLHTLCDSQIIYTFENSARLSDVKGIVVILDPDIDSDKAVDQWIIGSTGGQFLLSILLIIFI